METDLRCSLSSLDPEFSGPLSQGLATRICNNKFAIHGSCTYGKAGSY